MLPKPSLVLQMRLLPEEYSEDQAAEIKRSYIYMAQSVVSALEENELAQGNLIRLNVRLMKPHWDVNDSDSQMLWEESFMPWLTNATRNISTAMHNYNLVSHPNRADNVVYEWADYDFSPNAVLRIKVDGENRIPTAAPQYCAKVRQLCADGIIGDEVKLVRIPSLKSLEAQEAEYAKKLDAYNEAVAAYQAAKEMQGGEPDAANEATQEVAGTVDTAEGVIDTIEVSETMEKPEASEMQDLAIPEKPIFEIDYSVWGFERFDGTVEEYTAN